MMNDIGLLETDKESEIDLDDILVFQKSAIYRQCLEYKRLYFKELENSEKALNIYKNLQLENSELKLKSGNITEINQEMLQLSKIQGENASLLMENQLLQEKNQEISKENAILYRKIDRLKIPNKKKEISEKQEKILEKKVEKDETDRNSEKLKRNLEIFENELQIVKQDLEKILKEKMEIQVELDQVLISKVATEKYLEMSRNSEKDLEKNLEITREKLQKSLNESEKLKGNYKEFQKSLLQEESDKRKKLLMELKGKEEDNARLRKERDSFKYKFDLKNVQESPSSRVNEELSSLSSRQKERIHTLEMDLARLKSLIAHENGNKELQEFFRDNLGGDVSKYFQEKLADAEKKIQELENVVEAITQSDPGRVEKEKEWLEKEAKYKSQIETLEKQNSHSNGIKNGELVGSLPTKDQEITDLKNKIEYFNKAQTGLLKEIENLGKSWADLEAQNTKKILNLASIEDLKSKHKEDKLKLEQKCSLLTRQSATVDNARIALKKQCQKQSEMIIKQQEREKLVSEQLVALEKEHASHSKLLEEEKMKVSDLMAQISTFEAQNAEVNRRCENMISLVKSKSEALESESAAKLKVQEQLASLTKKLEILDKDGDANLREQLQNYKLLLKCSSCNNRFKSHVLLKCMHVFCKECLDDMYNSRQRKCPSCSLPFGQLDMKQIFL